MEAECYFDNMMQGAGCTNESRSRNMLELLAQIKMLSALCLLLDLGHHFLSVIVFIFMAQKIT